MGSSHQTLASIPFLASLVCIGMFSFVIPLLYVFFVTLFVICSLCSYVFYARMFSSWIFFFDMFSILLYNPLLMRYCNTLPGVFSWYHLYVACVAHSPHRGLVRIVTKSRALNYTSDTPKSRALDFVAQFPKFHVSLTSCVLWYQETVITYQEVYTTACNICSSSTF